MDQNEQRIAIAEACGLDVSPETIETARSSPYRVDNIEDHLGIPDYLNDLNAMHEAEKILTDPDLYEQQLEGVCNGKSYIFHATAAQRAEAFLRTIGKWKDDRKSFSTGGGFTACPP